MVRYNTIAGVKAYRDHPALNQSALKAFISGKKFNGESLSMLFGSYLDVLVTMQESDLEHLYVNADAKRPSEKMTKLLSQFKWTVELTQTVLNPSLEVYRLKLETWLEDKEYYQSSTPQSRAGSFIKAGSDWWQFIIELGDKTVISLSDIERIEGLQKKVNFEFLNPILKGDKYDVLFQKDFFWTEEVDRVKIECKGLADIILESEFEIIEIDLKFTECKTLESFFYVMRDLNYPFQKAFYKRGLEKNYAKKISMYWLVVSDSFIHLIPCNKEMLEIGELGYSIHKETFELHNQSIPRVNKVIGVQKALEMWSGVIPSPAPFKINGDEVLKRFFL